MKPRQFIGLAIAALLSAAAAVAIYRASTPWQTTNVSGGKLAPGLAANADAVSRIEIAQGKSTLTLDRKDGRWLITSQDGFPATPEKVRALLVAISEGTLTEPKTRNKDRFDLLSLGDPKKDTATAREIKILDDKGTVLFEIIAGKTNPTTGGSYVRKPGSEETWLASTPIEGGPQLNDWTQQRLYEVPGDRVAKVSVNILGEAPLVVKREGGEPKLQDIPAGKKLKFVNAVDNIVEAASFLDFTTVKKAATDTRYDAGTVDFETDNGLKVSLKLRRDGERAWAAVAVEGKGDTEKAASEIKARADGWEFEILPGKVTTMLKKRDELLEDAAS